MARYRFLVGPNELFSPKGRIGRVQFLNFWICMVIMLAIAYGADRAPDFFSDNLNAQIGPLLTWLNMVLTVLIYYALFCLLAMRLHDIGLSAWFALILFIPVAPTMPFLVMGPAWQPDGELVTFAGLVNLIGSGLNFLIGIVLTFWPGNPGNNRYGPQVGYPPTTDEQTQGN